MDKYEITDEELVNELTSPMEPIKVEVSSKKKKYTADDVIQKQAEFLDSVNKQINATPNLPQIKPIKPKEQTMTVKIFAISKADLTSKPYIHASKIQTVSSFGMSMPVGTASIEIIDTDDENIYVKETVVSDS